MIERDKVGGFMIKMVVTDLDGTLLRSDKTISEYMTSIFRRYREKGINAKMKVKIDANFMCDTNENDGVAKWIEENIL